MTLVTVVSASPQPRNRQVPTGGVLDVQGGGSYAIAALGRHFGIDLPKEEILRMLDEGRTNLIQGFMSHIVRVQL